jgi:hypothetical protein
MLVLFSGSGPLQLHKKLLEWSNAFDAVDVIFFDEKLSLLQGNQNQSEQVFVGSFVC